MVLAGVSIVETGEVAVKRVFIASPYSAPTESAIEINRQFARKMCRLAIKAGCAPFAPHLLYTQFLDDSDPDDRAAGIGAGISFLLTCHGLWRPAGVTPTKGMAIEIEIAKSMGIPIVEVAL